ncbi:MAG: DUF4097 family beta strand repeat protein [Acidimicrobiales bacterium]|nr:DUF4097 family beta strand repeat protein [Acidimicrobiales bacterium]
MASGGPPIHIAIHIASRSAAVSVVAEDGAALAVTGGRVHTLPDGTVVVDAERGSRTIEVRCPPLTRLSIGTASGRVELKGALGDVRVTTFSGRVDVEQAEHLEVRSRSGSVHVGWCRDECRVVAKSAKVTIDRAARAHVASVSGRVEATEVQQADVRTVSGRVALEPAVGAHVNVHSLSGTVEVAVPAGCRPATRLHSLSGRISCDLPAGSDGVVDVRTGSGRIQITNR